MALPVGPGCYYPPRAALVALVDDVRSLQNIINNDIQLCLKDLQYWKSAHTYKVPSRAEEGFTRPNLESVMHSIIHRIPESDKKSRKFLVESANSIVTKIPFIFAKQSSLCEPVVTCRCDGTSVGFIASAAKALDASMLMTYVQAVQVASDCAVNMGRLFMNLLSTENIIVPFITTSWDDIQFGAVYLMDNFYPSAVLLSSRLSLNCHVDMCQICYWIIALSRHCVRIGEMLKPLGHLVMSDELSSTSTSPLAAKRARLEPNVLSSGLSYYTPETSFVSLPRVERYFYKPITLTSGSNLGSFRALLSSLMSRFYDMYHFSSALREIVVFPEGILAYPNEGQVEMCAFLNTQFRSLFQLKGMSEYMSTELLAQHCIVGYPIVVYPRLDPADWRRGDLLLNEPSNEVVAMFIDKVKETCRLLVSAGIIHMDMRLYNIFYRVETDVDGSPSDVRIRVIDWDDSVRLNQYVPEEYLQITRLTTRFPGHYLATPEYHEFFIRSITDELSSRINI